MKRCTARIMAEPQYTRWIEINMYLHEELYVYLLRTRQRLFSFRDLPQHLKRVA